MYVCRLVIYPVYLSEAIHGQGRRGFAGQKHDPWIELFRTNYAVSTVADIDSGSLRALTLSIEREYCLRSQKTWPRLT